MNKRTNVYLMYAIVFLQGFVFYGPVATIYRQSRGLSMYDMFLIESISWILMIMLEIPWGWFADRFGYKKTIIISNLFFFISKIIFYKAFSFQMFLMERVFLSLALAGLSGCDAALIYSSINESESEKVFGRYSAASTIGFLAASLISTIIIERSMDLAALLTIIPYGIAVILTLFLRDTEIIKEDKPKLIRSLRAALKNKEIIVFIISIALIREVVQSVSVFLNQPQYIRSGINMKYFGILVAVVQIIRLGSAKAYSLSNRFGKNASIQGLLLIIALSCLCLIFTTNPIVSILCIVLVSGSMALIEPISMDIENKTILTGDRATILSIYAMIGDLVSALINPVIGRASDVTVGFAFEICSIICIAASCMFLIYKAKIRKSKEVYA